MEAPERSRIPTRLVVLLATLGLVAIGLALAAGAYTYTGESSFCNSCHTMNTRYVSWQRSTHAQVTRCMDCHEAPGPLGELRAHVAGARYLFVMLTGESSGTIIRAEVAQESCLNCHRPEQLARQIGKHRVEHSAHLTSAREVTCTDCHGNLVHGSLYGTAARPAMATCVDCHQRTVPAVVNTCTACHGPGPVRPGGGRVSALPQGAP